MFVVVPWDEEGWFGFGFETVYAKVAVGLMGVVVAEEAPAPAICPVGVGVWAENPLVRRLSCGCCCCCCCCWYAFIA